MTGGKPIQQINTFVFKLFRTYKMSENPNFNLANVHFIVAVWPPTTTDIYDEIKVLRSIIMSIQNSLYILGQ